MEHFVPAAERDIERLKGDDLVTVAVAGNLDQPIIIEVTLIPSRLLSEALQSLEANLHQLCLLLPQSCPRSCSEK